MDPATGKWRSAGLRIARSDFRADYPSAPLTLAKPLEASILGYPEPRVGQAGATSEIVQVNLDTPHREAKAILVPPITGIALLQQVLDEGNYPHSTAFDLTVPKRLNGVSDRMSTTAHNCVRMGNH
ncbi:hypothetical protein JQ594_27000 [Bradyrhizobium manausense]|uniref:hypothetical protein n=1 Tax=Bradyrhizobium manausense TaxID=989370 RepID=UPI001BA614B5|nr:hypothetical protein [Bradyrhizobium manausense]MBR0689592.1 hypothetical protein [Bradyrhizobium manausense]